jgi:5-methyltetrahydropteroyltriglutamate--homocysteine methyltransferase
MKRSTDRILTTHAGSLPRPDDVRVMVTAKSEQQAYDEAGFEPRLQSAVAETVQQQLASGIDCVNDGEFAKSNFSNYARERIAGIETQPNPEPTGPAGVAPRDSIIGRDVKDFPEYFAEGISYGGPPSRRVPLRSREIMVCTGPLTYIGHETVQADVARLREVLKGTNVEEAFLPAIAPGTIEHWLKNRYYPNDEAYLYAIADVMHEEYKAIVDGGFILQIDNPDLPDGWQYHPELDVAEYHKYAELRIDALNHALRDLPIDRVRFHTCWGSYHGPHKYDIPLREIVDLVLKVRAEAYSIEASNPVHVYEWQVWQDVKLPEGKILIPGVVGHYSDFVEHPETVAQRLTQYASVVGRENVMAGTDCGLGTRVGHPKIVWAKFQAMAEGAKLASQRLWK